MQLQHEFILLRFIQSLRFVFKLLLCLFFLRTVWHSRYFPFVQLLHELLPPLAGGALLGTLNLVPVRVGKRVKAIGFVKVLLQLEEHLFFGDPLPDVLAVLLLLGGLFFDFDLVELLDLLALLQVLESFLFDLHDSFLRCCDRLCLRLCDVVLH